MSEPKNVVPLTTQKTSTEESEQQRDNPTPDAFRFMHEDLKRSGLVPEDMGCHITPKLWGRPEQLKHIICSYRIPFHSLDGFPIPAMWRDRRKIKPGAEKIKELGKYTQPSLSYAQGYGHLPYLPRNVWSLAGKVKTVHLCEGEKKAAALLKLGGVAALGLTGKDVSIETVQILAQAILKLGAVRVCIWPDADVRRFDVIKSYGKLRARLIDALHDVPELEVLVMQPSWDVQKYKGIDDALAAGWQFVEGSPVGEELPVPMRELADQISLDYSTGAKGSFEVVLNDDNVCRLLEHEPLWGRFWMNRDNGRWMVGDTYLDPEIEITTFTRRMQRVFGLRRASTTLVGNSMDHVCRLQQRSPWADWLAELKWDGVPRLDRWLQTACGVEDSSFVREVGIKWPTAVVARTMNPGCKADWMLITYGPQGCGKSSLPYALVPPQFSRIVALAPHTKEKELSMAAGVCRILCFDEMALFFDRKDDTEFIKQFVSATEDQFRPPYGKANVRENRGCVLYGSTNRKECVKGDASGYRRWVVVTVAGTVETEFGKQFDWKWLEENREQLWAEAGVQWRAGLDVSQVRGASTQAQGHVRDNHLEGVMLSILHALHTFKPDAPFAPGKLVTHEVYWKELTDRGVHRSPQNERAVELFWEQYECEKKRTGRGRGYAVSEKLLEVLNAPE